MGLLSDLPSSSLSNRWQAVSDKALASRQKKPLISG